MRLSQAPDMETPWEDLLQNIAPTSGPASTYHDQALRPLLRKSPELQAPPSPRHCQKPRAFPSSTRNQRFKKIAPHPGLLSGSRSSPGFRVWLRPEWNPG
ncbi:hypothetical protein F2Q70_00029201 [Brassica cretica]|uniref:Uncharacterized protein n=1 Tax=Brassica cretica TaxID=69181 RepID=A0A8S9FJD7_BRACR|nr:hypothetical protein F2Q70_00029201 [Brassica cretica]